MKIALTGAHGTGKTTLARSLPPILSSIAPTTLCREAARLVIAKAGNPDFFKRGNNTPLRQSLIYIEQLIEERRQARDAGIMITDRTMVDHLTYSAILFPEYVNGPEFNALKALAFESLTEYALIFKLNIEFKVVADGVREDDPEFQAAVNRTLDALYAEAGVTTIALSGTVEDRSKSVLSHVTRSWQTRSF